MSFFKRHSYIFIFITITIVTILFVGWLADRQHRAPISMSQDTFYPFDNPICAGDNVEFEATIFFERDAVFQIRRALVNLSTGLTELSSAGFPLFSIRRAGENLKNITLSYPTKSELLPGLYEYRVAIEESGSKALIFFVPFEIIECND